MIVIADYDMCNLRSVQKAFQRLSIDVVITSDYRQIATATKIIMPGVGHFQKGMENLRKFDLINILNEKVINQKTPVLGICLGMQLFSNWSEEGDVAGLGWIDAETVRFGNDVKDLGLKIPHMGWNTVEFTRPHFISKGLSEKTAYYFAHSYLVKCKHQDNLLAQSKYGHDFAAAVCANNIIGVQFHPEKSHSAGLQLIKNFLLAN